MKIKYELWSGHVCQHPRLVLGREIWAKPYTDPSGALTDMFSPPWWDLLPPPALSVTTQEGGGETQAPGIHIVRQELP